MVITVLVLFCLTSCAASVEQSAENSDAVAIAAEYKNPAKTPEPKASVEKQMWDYIVKQYHNQYAAAAMLGNSDFEAALCPYRTEGDRGRTADGRYPYSLEYTEKVDSGIIGRETFACAGPGGGAYGLFAWTSAGRKEGLYDFAKERGVSVSDWQMQLDYAYNEISSRYYELYCTFLTAESVEEATEAFGFIFERGINMEYSIGRRTEIAQQYYDRYADADFDCPYQKGTLLPVDGSCDYLDREFEKDILNSNIYVYMAQMVLHELEYLESEPCGYLGEETEEAIRSFQEDRQMEPTGILGPDVWHELNQ